MLSLALLAGALPCLAPPVCAAQVTAPAEKVPQFDVAALRPHKPDSSNDGGIHWDGLNFIATNAPIKFLLSQAYGVKMWLISGVPAWAESNTWDLQAKVVEGDLQLMKNLSREQRSAMLRNILEDRFHLKTHQEPRAQPVYEMTVLPTGAKFKATPMPSAAEGGAAAQRRQSGWSISSGLARGNGITMAQLANGLSYEMERPIVDRTGLAGMYDLEAHWTPDSRAGAGDNGAAGDALPEIFTALREQLGLKFTSTKAPVPTLVIDRMERPEDN